MNRLPHSISSSSSLTRIGLARTETLLRARAIETQCYVFAAAQVRSTQISILSPDRIDRNLRFPASRTFCCFARPLPSFFFLAVNQAGTHAPGRESYGHSLIISPFGEILASIDAMSQAEADEGAIATAEVDLESLHQIRREIPLWEQRRNDVYPEL